MQFSRASQLLFELRSLLSGYPGFVFQPNPAPDLGGVPVFVHHTIDPVRFEAQLEFLCRNQIETLSPSGFAAALDGDALPTRPAVLLTVDDGRSSFWRYGYPLLKKYDCRATVFVIPGRVPGGEGARPTLQDVWDGHRDADSVRALDPEDQTLCSWAELEQMYRSGLVAVESHTLFHREVFTAPRILDFVDDHTPHTSYNSPMTAYLNREDVGRPFERSTYLGLPLMPSAPLLAGKPALKLPPELLQTCRGFYEQNVGRPAGPGTDWKAQLRRQLASDRRFRTPPELQSPEEAFGAARDDLLEAKTMIEERLGPEAGQTLCLPYATGSDLAVRAAREAGVRSCFWGVRFGKRINRPGDDPYYRVRIKSDFIERLPGRGRRSLAAVYGSKIRRRLEGESVY